VIVSSSQSLLVMGWRAIQSSMDSSAARVWKRPWGKPWLCWDQSFQGLGARLLSFWKPRLSGWAKSQGLEGRPGGHAPLDALAEALDFGGHQALLESEGELLELGVGEGFGVVGVEAGDEGFEAIAIARASDGEEGAGQDILGLVVLLVAVPFGF
jgi:hypothetical protein